ncbi:MAG: hypothetical protein LBK24_00410 [Puniceicoccales bacterium]|jgi:hypothetical protein|nr:hypothetical protein [Puniceicoccales bacterium]
MFPSVVNSFINYTFFDINVKLFTQKLVSINTGTIAKQLLQRIGLVSNLPGHYGYTNRKIPTSHGTDGIKTDLRGVK